MLSATGTLPSGLKFTPGSNGTATISGSELALGTFHLTLTAKSAAGTTTQAFTLYAALL